jgi:D-arabinose 5-phosphate isomerase GutQ
MNHDALIKRAQSVVEQESKAVQQLAAQFDVNLQKVVDTLHNCIGHVLVTGAGTSRAVAVRFAHLLSCSGTPALFISSADALHGGAGAIKPGDVVYIISKGGQSAEVNDFATIARQRGAGIIAHTEKPDSSLGKISDVVYQVVAPGDVDPYGMIATGSSLVNSAACDVLCVLLLEKRGYSKEQFGATHPGGAVGKKIEAGQ